MGGLSNIISQRVENDACNERRAIIRRIFMAHGFTIKEGQTDLKPYVYEAAEALLRELSPAVAVPDGKRNIGTLPVKDRYFLCHCDKCGWLGSSEECRESINHMYGDGDYYCPACGANGPDEMGSAEATFNAMLAAAPQAATEGCGACGDGCKAQGCRLERESPPTCQTCNGKGMIGGLLPNGGGYDGEPCPDCAAQKATAEDSSVVLDAGAVPVALPPYNVFSDDDGDSWREHPADADFVDGLQLGDEFELLAGWRSVRATFRVTKVPDDVSDDYEVEEVTAPVAAQKGGA